MKSTLMIGGLLAFALSVPAAMAGEGCCPVAKATAQVAAQKEAATTATFAVAGMTCGGCEGKVKKALAGIDGVNVETVSHKDGVAKVSYDPAKTDAAKIQKTISDTGFKSAGQQMTVKVSGMTCGGCEGKVKKALAEVDGVKVEKVSHKEGVAVVTLDCAKTSCDKVMTAIKATGFKADCGESCGKSCDADKT